MLDFSFIEINKTALNKRGTCSFEGGTSGENVGEKQGITTDDVSGSLRFLLVFKEVKKKHDAGRC